MKAKSGRWIVRVFGVVLVSGAITAALYANHSWGNYHWARTENPLTLELGDNVSDTWDVHLGEASSDWNVSAVLDLTTVEPGGTDPKRCRATTGRVEVCAATYGFNGWLGLAQIWVDGDHITKAISKMNDSYFNTTTYGTPAWRQFVMCQEVGHTFGLGHQDEGFSNPNLGSCMDYTDDPDGSLRNQEFDNLSPNQHDFDELELIYAHRDSPPPPNEGGPGNGNGRGKPAAPPAMDDIDLAGPSQWGKLVEGSRQRGFSVYVLDFGGGHKVITHVLWVRAGHARE